MYGSTRPSLPSLTTTRSVASHYLPLSKHDLFSKDNSVFFFTNNLIHDAPLGLLTDNHSIRQSTEEGRVSGESVPATSE